MSTTAITDASVAHVQDDTARLLQAAAEQHTKPLWAQMTRLNPPAPNPQCVPHVWQFDQIRPELLKAGELITEKQAERRVLMLVNPARGMLVSTVGSSLGHP